MNIIRTKVAELSGIPAIAYKLKLREGGSGIKLQRTDKDAMAFATIDKRTGEVQPDARINEDLFPLEAFEEAVELLTGLPYSARGKVNVVCSEQAEEGEITVPEEEHAIDIVESAEFAAITNMYSDINGKMNYSLMNKQFIQFAAGSKTVSDMAGKKASSDELLAFIVKNRAAFLAGKKESLSDEEVAALIDAIEEMDTRGAFKDLKLYIRRRLAR